MPRMSTVDRLPESVRAEIGRLRQNGRTIDDILAHLRTLDGIAPPSRSALGRHVKGLAAIGERMRRSRTVAEALVRELGDAPESHAARLNVELMHTVVLDLFARVAEGEEGVDANGMAAVAGDPEGVMMLAKALDHLGRASKSNVEFIRLAEQRATERAKREAVATVEGMARERGISAETLAAIKSGIFGVSSSSQSAPRAP